MLLRYSQIPPRYTGKICATVLHAVPVAVLLHFLIAVYVFGERDLPSYTMDGTESGKWRHHGTKYVEDEQTDIGARLNRYNGFVPFMGFIIVSVMTIALYSVLLSCTAARRGAGTTTRNGGMLTGRRSHRGGIRVRPPFSYSSPRTPITYRCSPRTRPCPCKCDNDVLSRRARVHINHHGTTLF